MHFIIKRLFIVTAAAVMAAAMLTACSNDDGNVEIVFDEGVEAD